MIFVILGLIASIIALGICTHLIIQGNVNGFLWMILTSLALLIFGGLLIHQEIEPKEQKQEEVFDLELNRGDFIIFPDSENPRVVWYLNNKEIGLIAANRPGYIEKRRSYKLLIPETRIVAISDTMEWVETAKKYMGVDMPHPDE